MPNNEAPKYFRFFVYGDQWGKVEKEGTTVFENKDGIISSRTTTADNVFKLIAGYDLTKTEQILIDNGFQTFEGEELAGKDIERIGLSMDMNKGLGYNSVQEAMQALETMFPTLSGTKSSSAAQK